MCQFESLSPSTDITCEPKAISSLGFANAQPHLSLYLANYRSWLKVRTPSRHRLHSSLRVVYDSSFQGKFPYDGCVCCLWIFLHLPCAFSPFRAFALCFLLVVLRPIIM